MRVSSGRLVSIARRTWLVLWLIPVYRTLIFDIVRLWVMIGLTNSGPDITCKYFPPAIHSKKDTPLLAADNQAPVAMWTCLEGAVGIIGACLPNLRPLFRFGQKGFWTQLRSSSQRSGKTLLKSNDTNITGTTITSSTGGYSIKKPGLMSHVTDEGTDGIEIHRYSRYIEGETLK